MTAGNRKTEVYVTGIGSISAFGPVKGLIHQQQSPLRIIKGWPTRGLRKAYLVEQFLPSDVVPGLKTRRLDRLSVWALVASSLALQDAQVDLTNVTRSRCGVVFGTGFGPTELTAAFCGSVADFGCSKADAIVFPETLDNSAACHVARNFGLKGPNVTVTCRGISGEAAICQAASILESGEADLIIAIAGDVLTQALYDYYESTRVLAPDCFDAGPVEGGESRRRNGFVPGEGLAAFIMERGDRHLERRARTYARYRSGCSGADSTALPFSWGRSSKTTIDLIHQAMGSASLEDVGMVVSAGNGSPALDVVESESIRAVFGSSKPVHVVRPKELLGEFDGNALLRLVLAFAALPQCAGPGIVAQGNVSEAPDGNSQSPEGRLALLLGASTGGGRAALTFKLS